MHIDPQILTQILNFLKEGYTDRVISAKMNITRWSIQTAIKLLKSGKTFEDLTNKACIECNKYLSILSFERKFTGNKYLYCDLCKDCEKQIIEESHKGKNFEQFVLDSNIIDQKIIDIINLHNKGVTPKYIAKILCIDHQSVYKVYNELKIPSLPRAFLAQFQTEKICSHKDCSKGKQYQPIENFDLRINYKNGRKSYNSQCKDCRAKTNRISRKKHYTTEK